VDIDVCTRYGNNGILWWCGGGAVMHAAAVEGVLLRGAEVASVVEGGDGVGVGDVFGLIVWLSVAAAAAAATEV
jgi:hypothetical protein